MGLIMLGNDNQARCIFVNPVDNTRARHPANPRQAIAAMGHQGIYKRAIFIPGSRMNHKTRGLVDDNKVRIFIRNIQLHWFWSNTQCGDFRQGYDNHIASI